MRYQLHSQTFEPSAGGLDATMISTCLHVCSTSSHHDTVSTNMLGTLPYSATVLNLWCFWGWVWLVHIQCQTYPLLMYTPARPWPAPSVLQCQTTSSADLPLAAPSPTHFFPSSPLPESQSTIIDNFFLCLLCIVEIEGKYEAMFDIVQGMYASEGAATKHITIHRDWYSIRPSLFSSHTPSNVWTLPLAHVPAMSHSRRDTKDMKVEASDGYTYHVRGICIILAVSKYCYRLSFPLMLCAIWCCREMHVLYG